MFSIKSTVGARLARAAEVRRMSACRALRGDGAGSGRRRLSSALRRKSHAVFQAEIKVLRSFLQKGARVDYSLAPPCFVRKIGTVPEAAQPDRLAFVRRFHSFGQKGFCDGGHVISSVDDVHAHGQELTSRGLYF